MGRPTGMGSKSVGRAVGTGTGHVGADTRCVPRGRRGRAPSIKLKKKEKSAQVRNLHLHHPYKYNPGYVGGYRCRFTYGFLVMGMVRVLTSANTGVDTGSSMGAG